MKPNLWLFVAVLGMSGCAKQPIKTSNSFKVGGACNPKTDTIILVDGHFYSCVSSVRWTIPKNSLTIPGVTLPIPKELQ